MAQYRGVYGKDFFGPSEWHSIHCAAMMYDPSRRESFKVMIESRFENLACRKCSAHALKNLKIAPIDPYLSSYKDVFFWSYMFHDLVNKQINEENKDDVTYTKKVSPPYEQVWKLYYDALRGEKCKDC